MFAILYSLTHSKNRYETFKHNILIMIVFACLYYGSYHLAKYLQYDLNPDEGEIIKCIHFSLVTQSGIGYGIPFKNPISFYVNLIHIMYIFVLTLGML